MKLAKKYLTLAEYTEEGQVKTLTTYSGSFTATLVLLEQNDTAQIVVETAHSCKIFYCSTDNNKRLTEWMETRNDGFTDNYLGDVK